MIYVFIGKISTDPNADCQGYYTRDNTNCKNIRTHFHVQIKLFQLILLHQYSCYIPPPIYLPTLFCTYNFHNLNIHQHRMIHCIHIHSYQDFKHILYHIHLHQSILYICINIYHHSNVVYYQKHLHLIYMHTDTFHAILYVLFHQFLTLD